MRTTAGLTTYIYDTLNQLTGVSYPSGRQVSYAYDAAGNLSWRTNNALSGSGANWTFVSGSFATNAIGTLTLDASNSFTKAQGPFTILYIPLPASS